MCHLGSEGQGQEVNNLESSDKETECWAKSMIWSGQKQQQQQKLL